TLRYRHAVHHIANNCFNKTLFESSRVCLSLFNFQGAGGMLLVWLPVKRFAILPPQFAFVNSFFKNLRKNFWNCFCAKKGHSFFARFFRVYFSFYLGTRPKFSLSQKPKSRTKTTHNLLHGKNLFLHHESKTRLKDKAAFLRKY
ncbi:MAG: hypothetical protein FWF05_07775, partial [Oscillospiraceae bacterium]|nr:hypothetical protein [Oscillospiraceae bacterium]